MRAIAAAIFMTAAGLAAAHAQSVENTSAAVAESAEGAAALAEAGVRATAGSVAVPLASAGAASEIAGEVPASVGVAAGDAAGALWEAANTPLTIGDEVIVAADAPPSVAAEPFSEIAADDDAENGDEE